MDPTSDAGFYVRVLRRGWRPIVAAVAAGLALGALAFALAPRTYAATASVLVTDTGAAQTTAVGERTTGGDVNLDTEAQLLKSADVIDRVLAKTGDRFAADTIASQVSVQVPANTTVLDITFTAATPRAAQLGAQAFADAYLANRGEVAQESLDHSATSYETQLRAAQNEQQQLRNQLRSSDDDLRDGIQTRLQTVAARVATLSEGLVAAESTVVTPGRTINEPARPLRPASPHGSMLIMSGGALGLLTGLGFSMYRERVRPRIDDEDDAQRELQLPGLAEIRRPAAGVVHLVATPETPQALSFGQLRRRLDLLHVEDNPGGRRIVVASVSSDAAALHVAFNLGWQYAYAGTSADVIIDGGDTPPGLELRPASPGSRLLQGSFVGEGVLHTRAPLTVHDLGDHVESASEITGPRGGVTIVCLRRASPLVELLTSPGDVAVLLLEARKDRAPMARQALKTLSAGGAVHVVGVVLHDGYPAATRWASQARALSSDDVVAHEDDHDDPADDDDPRDQAAPDDHGDDRADDAVRRPASVPVSVTRGPGAARPSPLWTPAALAGRPVPPVRRNWSRRGRQW